MEPIPIDGERLRKDLIDHFGTSPFGFKFAAVADIETMSPDEVIQLAMNEGFDLDAYRI